MNNAFIQRKMIRLKHLYSKHTHKHTYYMYKNAFINLAANLLLNNSNSSVIIPRILLFCIIIHAFRWFAEHLVHRQ